MSSIYFNYSDNDSDSYFDPNVKAIYDNVRTWEDLINTNVNFLEGLLHQTFYYGCEFHDHHYMNGVDKIEQDLIRLHVNHSIFTHNSQNVKFTNTSTWQRGYVSFVCENDPSLVQKLLDDTRIYTFARMEYDDNTSEILHNCPDRVVLTHPVGANFVTKYWEEDNEMLELSQDFPHIEKLFKTATHVTIMLREHPTKKKHNLPEATRCLLDALNDTHDD